MTGEILASLDRARDAIDEVGELPWQQRAEIRPLLVEASAWNSVEIASARRVLPVWSASYAENLPFDVLDLADQAAADDAARWRLEAAHARLQARLNELIFNANGDPVLIAAGIAGWAAMCAAASVLGWNDDAPPNELDGDPYDWSASFAGSVAAAGGATWEEGVGNPELRRAYWQWWLNEAIPASLGQA